MNVVNDLIDELDIARNDKYNLPALTFNFTRSSRKARRSINRLSHNRINQNWSANIAAFSNVIVLCMIENTHMYTDKFFSAKIRHELSKLMENAVDCSKATEPSALEKLSIRNKSIKLRKTAGKNCIFPEFVKHFGPKVESWLLYLFSSILKFGKLPKLFKNSLIVAILKPGNDSLESDSYRPRFFS